jgi:hypothetical protein
MPLGRDLTARLPEEDIRFAFQFKDYIEANPSVNVGADLADTIHEITTTRLRPVCSQEWVAINSAYFPIAWRTSHSTIERAIRRFNCNLRGLTEPMTLVPGSPATTAATSPPQLNPSQRTFNLNT